MGLIAATRRADVDAGSMTTIEQDIRILGNLAATHELNRRGHTQAGIRIAVQGGRIIRVRTGWYGPRDLDPRLARAARVGGRLTCSSAAGFFGLWLPATRDDLHVAVVDRSCQLRTDTNYLTRLSSDDQARVIIHWNDDKRLGNRLLVDPRTMLAHVADCQSAEYAFVVAESVLRDRLLTPSAFAAFVASCPRRVRRALEHAGALSGSGSESIFSYRMRALGIRFRQQVQISEDRVDFLIGDWLVVEIDSFAHHTLLENARRDARLGARGYLVLRFMLTQIEGEWDSVQIAVQAALARGDHLAR